MRSRISKPGDEALQNPQDFSFALRGAALPASAPGAPHRRCAGSAAQARPRHLAVCLAAFPGALRIARTDVGGGAAVPFLKDISVHVRFLVALPLLIVAEIVVHQRTRPLVNQFLKQDLIPESARTRFDAGIASVFRLRNSVLAEVLLIAFVYGFGVLIVWRHYMSLERATWYATPSAGGSTLSLAGM